MQRFGIIAAATSRTPDGAQRLAPFAARRMTTARPGVVHFGSAQLLVDRMPVAEARALLEIAVEAGAARLDTAPLYGHGGSEALVGEVASRFPGLLVTTKVGLEPAPAPSRARAAVGALLRQMPPAVLRTLRSALGRGGDESQADGPSGRFEVGAVKASIERSLSRLGAIDRLLLHEVHPADITDELLELLAGYRRRGDVNLLGVATGNAVTAEALRRSHGLFGVAHVSVDPLGPDLDGTSQPARPGTVPAVGWPATDVHLHPVQYVGHGALGASGRTLVSVRRRLDGDAALAGRWKAAVAGSPFNDRDGLAAALFARAAAHGPGELLIASRSPERVPMSVLAASGALGLPAELDALLTEVLTRSYNRTG